MSFLKKHIKELQGKRIFVFCDGASPYEADAFAQMIAHNMKEKHNLHLEEQRKVEQWLMPRIRPGCDIDYGVGRVLFAGEIAGFLNPMGEGISAGMESGFCAANAMMNHFDSPASAIEDYKERTRELHDYMKRQWNFVAGMAEPFQEMKVKG